MNNLMKTGAVIILSIIITPAIALASCGAQISRTLTAGMKGNDVKIMQQFLNDFPEYQISKTGTNSKGKESGVYDIATVKAFKKFQTNNATLILKPAGLKIANGVVGKYSRSIINNSNCTTSDDALAPSTAVSKGIDKETSVSVDKEFLDMKARLSEITKILHSDSSNVKSSFSDEKTRIDLLKQKIESITQKSASMDAVASRLSDEISKSTSTLISSSAVSITMILPTSSKPGDTIYIFASNLTASNKIYLSDKIFTVTLAKPTDKFVKLVIPATLLPGSYDIYVENVHGKSEKANIRVTGATVSSVTKSTTPTITSVSPKTGNMGTPVVITGTGFTKDNTIHTTTKSFFGISSDDGKTLKFTIDSEKNLLNPNGKIMAQLPFTFFVRNQNGDSNVMTLKLE